MMRIKIIIFFMVLVATVILTGNTHCFGAERDCPMLEARHITSVRVTFAGFRGLDQYRAPMQVNGTWDLPFTKYYPDSACEWSTKTPSGHTISLTVLNARHPQGGAFLLIISASKGEAQAQGTKLLSDDPYGNWLVMPIPSVNTVTAGTTQVSAVSGMQKRPAAVSAKYVAADVARLREGPSAESPSLLRLRINSPLEILEQRTPWLKVIALGAMTGWIREELVLDQPLNADEAWKRATASTGDERLGWLERTVAIDPAHKAAWTALRDAYAAAGKKDRAKAVELLLSGRDRFFVAECDHGMAMLKVVFESKGNFVKLRHQQVEEPSSEVLASFADDVSAWPWYAITKTSAKLLPGTPFPLPTVDTDGNTVRLGRCPSELDESQVLTTAPFIPEQLKPGKGGRSVFVDSSGLKLEVRDERGNVSWTVLGRDDKPLKKRDGTVATWRRTENGPPCLTQYFHPGRWYRNRLSGVLYGSMDCNNGLGEWQTIIFPAEGIVDSVDIFTEVDYMTDTSEVQ